MSQILPTWPSFLLFMLSANPGLPAFVLGEVGVAFHLNERNRPHLVARLVGAGIHQVTEYVGRIFDGRLKGHRGS